MGDDTIDTEGRPAAGFLRRGVSRRSFFKGAAVSIGATGADLGLLPSFAFAANNPIVAENALAGSPDWDLGFLDDSIEGFPTEFSVNAGERIDFKIRTVSNNYRVDIYRVGWYGGVGASKKATISPSVSLPQSQPPPLTDPQTGIIDCGNWAVSCSWTVPASAVSGVYVANMIRLDTNDALANRVIFVVRNDGRSSDVLVQTSDTTYQAYNDWGGNSLYFGTAQYDRAVKVSYNRPTIITELENEFWYAEYPLVRWLERNGYDVSYTSCIDTDRRPAELLIHQVFVSSGHDEYWSGAQRANVEAARDAGVNLAFITGNEVFWKVRWEPSTDASATPYRTLVCYKETLADAKIDPSPEWTGTWRDPRFSPPSNGGRPENALTGTLFVAINPVEVSDFPIKVPYSYGQLRMWRDTSIANLAPGETASLTRDTLGYEFNTDGDIPGRPPGLIRFSETTVQIPQVMRDYGKNYSPGPVTHYVTMYRADGGGLVWSTGTVQWAWGLDEYHVNRPNIPVPVDARMQQATLNVLSDMGVQPNTLQPGLVTPSPSSDTTPPTTVITSPAQNQVVPIGSPLTITGSVTDVGGLVASVEVSTDGGVSWRAATGTVGSWSYQFIPTDLGPVTVLVRAIDDSCNVETPKELVVIGGERPYPCSLWSADTPAPAVTGNDNAPLELGVRFRTAVAGFATGIRFYKAQGDPGVHQGRLWSANGVRLATVDFVNETAAGWQTAILTPPMTLAADTEYVVSYGSPVGAYTANPGYFDTEYSLYPLIALGNSPVAGNGVYQSGTNNFPNRSFGATNYWVDVVFDIDNYVAPKLIAYSPAANISSVDIATAITAQFDEAMDPGSIVMELRDAEGVALAGTTSYDAPTTTASFQPSAPLNELTTYVATVVGAADVSGDPITSSFIWLFTTAGAPGTVPTSLWTTSAVPAITSVADASPVELGMRFRSDTNGVVTGLRFYKGVDNTGTHLGHLWGPTGQLLATATFQNESASGWQEATLETPVEITAGVRYVVSYYAPNGGYSADLDYFGSSDTTRGPLSGLSSPTGGPNGLYRYGSGGGFPTNNFRSSNYWVDVVFMVPVDETAPYAIDWAPSTDLIGAPTLAPLVVEFDKPIEPSSVSFSVTDDQGGAVAGSTGVSSDGSAVNFTPAQPLGGGLVYTATVDAVASGTGVPMDAPHSWSFETAVSTGYPASLWTKDTTPVVLSADDPTSIEVGVKWRCDADVAVVAIQFFKGSANPGPHVGRLWTSTGTLLGTATSDNETATGWQQAKFTTPISANAGDTYVASYLAPSGGYSATSGGFNGPIDRPPLHALANGASGGNGVFRYGSGGFPTNSYGSTNYWVDVVVVDQIGPSVTSQAPAPNGLDVVVGAAITVGFSEPVQPSSVIIELRDGGGALVAGTIVHDTVTNESTFTPSSPLASNSAYSAYVVAAEDLGGNPLAAAVSWSFTTANTAIATLFGDATPSVASNSDNSSLELGLRFLSNVAGTVTAIRFYKGAANTGAHVGHLWGVDGTLLATTAFENETASGWQVAPLATPISVVPGTPYVVSYYAPNGAFSLDFGFFNNGDHVSGPLVAPGVNASPNGLFLYAANGGFPSGSYGASNYWVDVVFEAD